MLLHLPFTALNMANHIKLPYSETSGHIPSVDRIHTGELWINGADNIIGTKNQDGSIIQFAQFTPQQRTKLLSADYIPKAGFVDKLTFSQLPTTLQSPTIAINDTSDTAIEYTVATDNEVVNITINKTTGHKATKLVINKPAGLHCTINWAGVDHWLSTVEDPVFGFDDQAHELCVAVFTSKTLNAVNVIYNTEDNEADELQNYWGNILGDINDQQDLIDLFSSKADKEALNSYVPINLSDGTNNTQIISSVDSGDSRFEVSAQTQIENPVQRSSQNYYSSITGSTKDGIRIAQRSSSPAAMQIINETGDINLQGDQQTVSVNDIATKSYTQQTYLGINDTAQKAKQLATDITFALSGACTSDPVSTNGTTNIVIPVKSVLGYTVTGEVSQAATARLDKAGNEIHTTYATVKNVDSQLATKVDNDEFNDTIKNYVTTSIANATFATKNELAQKQPVGDYATNQYVNQTAAKYLPLTGGEIDGSIRADSFIGAFQGNADSATKATQDGSGNVIESTYVKVAETQTFTNVQVTGVLAADNTPTENNHVANKSYVDSAISAIDLSPYATVENVQSTYYTKTQATTDLATKADKTTLNDYLLKSGGEITGPLIVQQPTAPNHPATKQYVDNAVSAVYKYKGNVANKDALPSENNTVGDVYNVNDTGHNYVWTGTEWDQLAGIVDLSGYLTKSEAQSTYITPNAVAGTYLAKSDASSTYLTQTNASNTYLSKDEASTTYVTQTDASSTYLTQTNATNTYLSKNDASRTYLTKTQAASTYSTPSAVTNAISALDSRFLQLTGGTVTGPITLPGAPSAANQAATKQYVDDHSGRIPFTSCATASATAAKTVSSVGFVRSTGARVTVLFTNGNTGSNPTLNVRSTGAYPIWYLNQPLNTSDLIAGVCVDLVFDGAHWVIIGSLPNVRSYSTIESDNRYALKTEALTTTQAADLYALRKNPTIIGTLSIVDA